MKTWLIPWLSLCMTLPAAADENGSRKPDPPGLVAHYFRDPANWGGNWPDNVSTPANGTDPATWTFTEYAYSRVEPVINHLFIHQGWFSVRWKGDFDPAATDPDTPTGCAITGNININPNNRSDYEFVLTLPDGRAITRDNLTRDYPGYEGPAATLHVRPKGNGNQNSLVVNELPYPLVNARAYDIEAATMNVRLYNDKVNRKNKAVGTWQIAVQAGNAVILCRDRVEPQAPSPEEAPAAPACWFEIWADDGCRLFVDGKRLIEGWVPCWEDSADALRASPAVRLADGKHRFVVEYFQGVSLEKKEDRDPIKVYWSCPARRITRQIIPPSHFTHQPADTTSPNRD